MKAQRSLLALVACFAGSAGLSVQAALLECDNYVGMGEGFCIKLDRGRVILQPDTKIPRIQIDRKVFELKKVSSNVSRKTKPLDNMPGYTTQDVYVIGKSSSLTVTYEVTYTSCEGEDESGRWVVSEGCCVRAGKVSVRLPSKFGARTVVGKYQSGE